MLSAAAVVVCALALLGRSPKDTVPIYFVDHAPPYASRNVEAYVLHDPDAIYLVTSSSTFRDAQRAGGPDAERDAFRKIASIIVHEEFHLRNGPSEKGAYEAQLLTLYSLGAGAAVIASVRSSMIAVLEGQKRARQVEVMARVR